VLAIIKNIFSNSNLAFSEKTSLNIVVSTQA